MKGFENNIFDFSVNSCLLKMVECVYLFFLVLNCEAKSWEMDKMKLQNFSRNSTTHAWELF